MLDSSSTTRIFWAIRFRALEDADLGHAAPWGETSMRRGLRACHPGPASRRNPGRGMAGREPSTLERIGAMRGFRAPVTWHFDNHDLACGRVAVIPFRRWHYVASTM